MKTTKTLLLILLSNLIGACSSGTVYTEYHSFSQQGWHADSVIDYTFSIDDTTATYDIIVNVRHQENYPYQNMWLFVENDTIEFYLADNYGNWLGNGKNGLIEMPVLCEHNYTFPHSGSYTWSLQHGMRADWLKGINAVGLQVTKIDNGKK